MGIGQWHGHVYCVDVPAGHYLLSKDYYFSSQIYGTETKVKIIGLNQSIYYAKEGHGARIPRNPTNHQYL